MKWVIFGDLHINKPFHYLNSCSDAPVEQYYFEGMKKYIMHISARYPKAVVCFLGDVVDRNAPNPDYYEKFQQLVDLLTGRGHKVVVLIGNHDSGGSYNLEHAKIIESVSGCTFVYEFTKTKVDNTVFYFFPYMKNDEIVETWKKIDGDNVVVLSHNNIYCSDFFYNTPMINFYSLPQKSNVTLINGHIHRFYAEKGYYQIGSVNPTSFKEYLNAVGCVVVDTTDYSFKLHKNPYMFLASISKPEYIPQLERFLQQATKFGAFVFLRMIGVRFDYKRFPCVVAYQYEEPERLPSRKKESKIEFETIISKLRKKDFAFISHKNGKEV